MAKNYTTADIKVLREKTGAGMLDVKKALDEADGNLEKAAEIIRLKGLKSLSKREGRATSAGLIVSQVVDQDNGQVGVMIEINSETDFVAKNDTFKEFANKVMEAAIASKADDVDSLLASSLEDGTVKDSVDGIAAVIGEKIEIRRLVRLTGEKVEAYLHYSSPDLPPQVGVLVATEAVESPVAHDVALHIAAYQPEYLSREDIPADVLDKERSTLEELTKAEGKPENIVAQIVAGRLNGFFKENCLVDQAFAKDPKTTVGKVVAATGGKILGFSRFQVGT